MSDALEALLRLVAEGRLTAEEAAPLIAALDEPPATRGADAPAAKGDLARHVRVEVTERGRSMVNLRVPLALGQAAVSYVPGLDSGQAARVREALSRGIIGPIIEIADEDGDGVRIVLE
ncbi:MAG: SHOCT-like domain-containing protein [Candidatus Limnocylindrales bacterium]